MSVVVKRVTFGYYPPSTYECIKPLKYNIKAYFRDALERVLDEVDKGMPVAEALGYAIDFIDRAFTKLWDKTDYSVEEITDALNDILSSEYDPYFNSKSRMPEVMMNRIAEEFIDREWVPYH